MPRNTSRLEAVATIGIDIGKNTFHLIGLDSNGAIVLRQKLSRRQVEARLANMPPCLVGMEACVGAHHLSRQLKALGHERSPRAEISALGLDSCRDKCRRAGAQSLGPSPSVAIVTCGCCSFRQLVPYYCARKVGRNMASNPGSRPQPDGSIASS
jgi:hypothetical protein